MRIVACGSVDDGKSTLIGRLLAETDSVPDDVLDYARNTRRSGSTIPPGEVDYSMLTDGLEAEHEQGITIDVAYRHLYLPSGRRAIIADAPGHEQYTRNMAVAASTADVAILLVDASRGIRPQTHRHLTVCALMGVRTVIVAINKMDAVDFEHVAFEEFAGGVRAAAARLRPRRRHGHPGQRPHRRQRHRASTQMPWYHGPTVLGGADVVAPAPEADQITAPFRLPVQYVVRADDFRGYAGTVVAGASARATRSSSTPRARPPPSSGSSRGSRHRRGDGRPRCRRSPSRPRPTSPAVTCSSRTRERLVRRPVPAAGRRVRGRPGVDRRGRAASRSVLPAGGRLARRAGRRHRDPSPARRRLRRGDGRRGR